MDSEIKLKCSKKYEENLKKTFKYVESTSEEKTIVINDDMVCEFNPALYPEQRIARCMSQHNKEINQVDKINMMVSLNVKTNRFLSDCDESLFDDFALLSDVDMDMFYNENRKTTEKSYHDVCFEASLFALVEQYDNVAHFDICESIFTEYNKTHDDMVCVIKNLFNVEIVDYFVMSVKDENSCNTTVYIYSPLGGLENIYIDEAENTNCGSNLTVWEYDCKFKISKLINSIKEIECFA